MKKIDKREVRAWQKFDKVHIELLEAGVELLSEKAISSLTLNSLAKYTDISKTSIYNQLATLQILIETHKLKSVIEIGVEGVNSTIAILQSLKKTKGLLYSIDILPLQFHLLDLQKLNQNWKFIKSDSLKILFKDLPFVCDLLFIDSKHTSQQLNAELKLFSPLVKHGGFIVLHDVNPEVLPQMWKAFKYFIFQNHIRNFWYYPNNNGLGVIQIV